MRAFIAIALIVSLTRCSSLTVQVDIADPKAIHVWSSERLLANSLPRVGAEPNGAIEERIKAMRVAKLHRYLESRSTEFNGLGDVERQKLIKDLENTFNDTIGAFYVYHERVLNKLGEQIRTESDEIADCEDQFRNYEAERLLRQDRTARRRSVAAKTTESSVQSDQSKQANQPQQTQKPATPSSTNRPAPSKQPKQATPNSQVFPSTKTAEPAQKIVQTQKQDDREADLAALKPLRLPTCNRNRGRLVILLDQREQLIADVERGPDFVLTESSGVLTSLIGQDGLFREPEAFAIAKAPEQFWSKNFDRSYSWSLLGDTNVAIKMESRGNFSIKGVSFDPSEVTRVASKVVTQSLLAWTQIAGVPALPGAARPGSTAVVLAQDDRERLAFDAQRNDELRALLAVADAVAASAARLRVENSRKSAIGSLAAIWAANKDRLMQRDQQAAASVLTLVPPEATVAPGETVTLYPAVTHQNRDVNVAINCATTDVCPFTNLPAHVVISTEKKGTGQIGLLAHPDASWKAYTILATLDASRPREATIFIAPTINFDQVPATLLARAKVDAVVDLTRQPAAGTVVEVKTDKNLTVTPAAATPIDGKLTLQLTAGAEGTGELIITPGATRPQTKTVTILKPVATASAVEVAVGEVKEVEIRPSVAAALLPQVELTLESPPDSVALIEPEEPGKLEIRDGKATFKIRGVKAGTSDALTVTLRGGDPVKVPVTVKGAPQHAIEAKNGETVIEQSLDLDLETPLTITLSSATLPAAIVANVGVSETGIVTVGETITIPASGGSVTLEITPVAAGTATITISDAASMLAPLTFEVNVQSAEQPEPENEL